MSGEVHLLKGSDPVLLADATRDLVTRIVGDADRGEVLHEFSGDDYDLGAVVLAATTVSMFGDRVVVARNMARFGVDDLRPVLDYLDQPSPDASLVLVWDKPTTTGARANPVPKKLSDAVKAAGGTVEDCGLPSGKGRTAWLDDQLSSASVRLSPQARHVVVERLGEDLNRLAGILAVLEATFGAGAGPLGPDDIEPFLGDSGSVPPWDLTDAIDQGRVADAVTYVQRMLQGGGRHPLQVMVTLQTHVERMLRLDGSGIRDEKEAAAVLGMKGSAYPAKKALAQGAALGSAKVARATQLVARADLDLRGRTEQPGEQVLELLVARLAALSGGRRRR
jgi:DNA polymerase III subunit delta